MLRNEMASFIRKRDLLILVLLSFTAVTAANSDGELNGDNCDSPNRCIRASECRRQQKETIKVGEREKMLITCGFDRLSLLVCCPPENFPSSHVTRGSSTTSAPRSTTSHPSETRRTTSSGYIETRPTQHHIIVSSTTQKTTITQKPTSYNNNENRRTERPSTANRPTRPTQLPFIDSNKHTEKPVIVDRFTQAPYYESTNTKRTTENSYTEKTSTTLRTPVVNRYSTSRPTVDSRPTHTTPKPWSYTESSPTPAQAHYVTHNKESFVPQIPVRVSRPEEEEEGRPIHQSQQIGSSPSIYINSKIPARPERFPQQESSTETDEDWNHNKKPVSTPKTQNIVFEEELPYYSNQQRPVEQSRPSEYPVEERPTRPTRTTTEPPRRPFEPPYIIDSPEGPPIQVTRPTSRPPNFSSTYPGANNVGSGESGHLWPSSQHVMQQRPEERPPAVMATSPPVRKEQDLMRHPNYRLLPQDVCGTTAAGPNRVVNGQNVTLGQFPWMALLGYRTSEAAEDFVSVCGGTLINWKYVLTAAHCLKNSVRLVRLGEHVITTQPDCDQDGLCADPVVDIEIELKIPHPSYGKPYLKNDIGLIRLRQAQPRLFSSYVRPICLPMEQEKQKPGRKLLVAGWGTTRRGSKISSDVLQMAVLPEIGIVECNDAQEDDILKPVVATQMCAGVNDHRSSSCHGDSGGPLMDIQQGRTGHRQYDEPVVVQVGIVSVGSDDCGLHGAPSIYTRVSSFTSWILDTLRD